MKKWAGSEAIPRSDEIAVVLDGTGYPRPTYERDEKIGSLGELWESSEQNPLFGTFLHYR